MVLLSFLNREGWAMAFATSHCSRMRMEVWPWSYPLSLIRKGWAIAFATSHCSRMRMEVWSWSYSLS